MPKPKQVQRFPWLTQRTLNQEIEFTQHRSAQLRSILPKSIYWIQAVPLGQISWNVLLIKDYVLFGDRPEHQALVDEYLSTLPIAA